MIPFLGQADGKNTVKMEPCLPPEEMDVDLHEIVRLLQEQQQEINEEQQQQQQQQQQPTQTDTLSFLGHLLDNNSGSHRQDSFGAFTANNQDYENNDATNKNDIFSTQSPLYIKEEAEYDDLDSPEAQTPPSTTQRNQPQKVLTGKFLPQREATPPRLVKQEETPPHIKIEPPETPPIQDRSTHTMSKLRATIQTRRKARGEGDIENLYPEKKPIQLTTADLERRERRREQNRRAARKCRTKKKVCQDKAREEVNQALQMKKQLDEEVSTLRREVAYLHKLLSDHCRSGCCLLPEDSEKLQSGAAAPHACGDPAHQPLDEGANKDAAGDVTMSDETDATTFQQISPQQHSSMLCKPQNKDIHRDKAMGRSPAPVKDTDQSPRNARRRRRLPPPPLPSPQHAPPITCPSPAKRPRTSDNQIVPSVSPNLVSADLSPRTPHTFSPHGSSYNNSTNSNKNSSNSSSSSNDRVDKVFDPAQPPRKYPTISDQVFTFDNYSSPLPVTVAPKDLQPDELTATSNVVEDADPLPYSRAIDNENTYLPSVGVKLDVGDDADSLGVSAHPLTYYNTSCSNLPSWELPNLVPMDLPGLHSIETPEKAANCNGGLHPNKVCFRYADINGSIPNNSLSTSNDSNSNFTNGSITSNKRSCARDLSKLFSMCSTSPFSTPGSDAHGDFSGWSNAQPQSLRLPKTEVSSICSPESPEASFSATQTTRGVSGGSASRQPVEILPLFDVVHQADQQSLLSPVFACVPPNMIQPYEISPSALFNNGSSCNNSNTNSINSLDRNDVPIQCPQQDQTSVTDVNNNNNNNINNNNINNNNNNNNINNNNNNNNNYINCTIIANNNNNNNNINYNNLAPMQPEQQLPQPQVTNHSDMMDQFELFGSYRPSS